MSERVEPALTAEEWAMSLPDWAAAQVAVAYKYDDEDTDITLDGSFDDHGLAARLLHGQPFEFTREMLHAQRSLAHYASGGNYCPVCRDHETGWTMGHLPSCTTCGFMPMKRGTYMDLAMDGADRIEALLPPEGA